MRIALGIEYDGNAYYGWQRQREVIGVQQVVEEAISKVANHTVEIFCAGRTDAGVHATNQVVHFDTTSIRDNKAWTMGVNANLPANVAVKWATTVDEDFHARFSATARRYRYIISNTKLRPGILGAGLSHYHQTLDVEKMHQAGQLLLGENDFTSFRAVQCQSKTPFRNLIHLNVSRFSSFIIIDIKANAFLHHMVRNITGSLLEIGMGNKPINWIAEVLAAKDRNQAAATAKAAGLYLVEVDYPEEITLPYSPIGPLFLPDE
ncbi:tRNA pseudouridine(38-40) synthase TruA [Flocculibacter collagenilyticus]|uniref:tRNA pseudouridine(38-40) synthase TruA n=1 Tax=Flocculibacter collagenilyticus TaxID=2744479 RepID=UPI0018F2BDE1|nr:tRNA pseudouridine(38-40) synthase TruA [Flocculibacter collagenilyticus]